MEFKVKDYYSNPDYNLMLDKRSSAYIRSQSIIAHENQVVIAKVRGQSLVEYKNHQNYLARSPILREYLGSAVSRSLASDTRLDHAI